MTITEARLRTKVDPLDLAGIDDVLTAEEKAVRASVRQLCSSLVDPYVAEWFEAADLPDIRGLAKELGALGLLGMHLEGYGCAGMSAVDYGLACIELEASDSGIRSLVSVQGSLAMFAIWRHGTEQQKQEWLPRMAAGESIGCFGLTESDHGSDPGSMRTRARRDGHGQHADWILDGTKMWITNGSVADFAVVWAQTDEGISGFVVPTHTAGFSTSLIRHKMSLRASVTSELVLDGVRLPHDAVLPVVRGLRGPLSCPDEARYGILWGAMGAARSAFQSALEYSTHRMQFGRPIGGFQLTQAKLASMTIELTRHPPRPAPRPSQRRPGPAPGAGEHGQAQQRQQGTRDLPDLPNHPGRERDLFGVPVMRHMSNLESLLTYEGTPEMHTLMIGHALTGQQAFR